MYTYDEVLEASTKYFNEDDLAAKVWVDKYALRDNEDNYLELTPEDMHWRIAKEFARIQKKKYSNPLTKKQIFDLLDRFKYIVPQGSPMFGIGNKYSITSLSNCYVLKGPEYDTYSAILNTDEQLVNISKRRGGVGICLDVLRPNGSPTRNAAKTSTGIVSWMERYSNSIREVGQNSRRGALMLTLSVHHPDILEFATVKNDDKRVTGANISVMLTKEFQDALKNNTDYELRWPVDSKKPVISRMINAKEVWDTIINSAWQRAEPGLLNWDAVLKGPADCYDNYRSVSTNPCCFDINEDVYVLTNKGPKEIKSVVKDDKVYTGRGYVNCSGYFKSGKADIYEVGFSNGQVLYITLNHKLATADPSDNDQFELTPLSLLSVRDKVCCDGGEVEITSIKYHKTGEVGCINVPYYHSFAIFDKTLNKCGIISGNSEIPLSPHDSCRLLALNLLSYVENPFSEDAWFNYPMFYIHAQTAQRLMDDLVDLESEKIDAILAKIDKDPEPDEMKQRERDMWLSIKRFNDEGRRTGLGITALGDTLAALGLKYGSDKSIDVVEEIYKTLKFGAYRSSVDMAKELGAFDEWDHNKEKNNDYLNQFKQENLQWKGLDGLKSVSGKELYNDMKKYGRRNIACLTTAPTGSLSILTQTSSGIEPVFMLSYKRRKKGNPGDNNFRVDFVDQNGDSWQEFEVYHPTAKKWMEITGKNNLEESPWFGACSPDIDPIKRVDLQAAAAKHIDHAISSTINLPNDVTEETISGIYNYAFDLGLKGITVYRDGCRSGVLVKEEGNQSGLSKTDAPKRPDDLPCDVHYITVKGSPYFVMVGLLNNEPYEVFAGRNNILDQTISSGIIHKMKRPKCYRAELDDGTIIQPITLACDDNEEALTRLISTSLRHGAQIQFVVEQLQKTHGDMTSFAKAVARALKTYIKDKTVSTQKCPDCHSKLVYENNCSICKNCGHSACS